MIIQDATLLGHVDVLAGLRPNGEVLINAPDRTPVIGGALTVPANELALRQRGYRSVAPPTSFFVTTTAGPLADGEQVRARQWGGTVGAIAITRAPQAS